MVLPEASICFCRDCETRCFIRQNAEMVTTRIASLEEMFHFGRGARRSQSSPEKKLTLKMKKMDDWRVPFQQKNCKYRDVWRQFWVILLSFHVWKVLNFPTKKKTRNELQKRGFLQFITRLPFESSSDMTRIFQWRVNTSCSNENRFGKISRVAQH